MHAFTFATLASLAAGALAQLPACMTTAQGLVVANNYRDLIHDALNLTFVQSITVTNYTDYTDSVITLEDGGCTAPFTLGTPVATSAQAFYDAQGHAGPIPFTILNVWNNCDTVFMRWVADTIGSVNETEPEQQVTGISILEAVANNDTSSSQPWLLSTGYTEFNSGAYAYDQGQWKPSCASSKA